MFTERRTAGAGIGKLVVFNDIVQELNVGFADISCKGPNKDNFSLFNQSQFTDMNTPLVYWPMVESSLGIVGACLPMLRPLFAVASSESKRRIQSPESNEEAVVMSETISN